MSAEEMTIQDLSIYLNLPTETLYKYVRAGKIPARKAGRRWVFDQDQIEAWLAEQSETNHPEAKPAVLVVDDEPSVRGVFKLWLEHAGYQVDEASDGVEALERIEDGNYQLMFLDLLMPRMNGLQTLQKVREMSDAPDVVIVTAHYNGDMMEEILKTGPTHVLKKPVERRRFLEAASMYLPSITEA
ncbi:MAG: response regulator [Kiritimatiellae bacterium]|nr:response regulator [Kiritimatiellia bacterium]